MKPKSYTDTQIKWILENGNSEESWKDLAEEFNRKFKTNKSGNAIRQTYLLWEGNEISSDEMVSNIKETFRAKKTKAKVVKENQAILEYLEHQELLVDTFQDILENNPLKVHKPVKSSKSKKKIDRVVVMHLSDTHFQSMID